MTIDPPSRSTAAEAAADTLSGQHHEEIVQFVFRAEASPGLLEHARALLDKAPPELADSFEQAVRTPGFAS